MTQPLQNLAQAWAYVALAEGQQQGVNQMRHALKDHFGRVGVDDIRVWNAITALLAHTEVSNLLLAQYPNPLVTELEQASCDVACSLEQGSHKRMARRLAFIDRVWWIATLNAARCYQRAGRLVAPCWLPSRLPGPTPTAAAVQRFCTALAWDYVTKSVLLRFVQATTHMAVIGSRLHLQATLPHSTTSPRSDATLRWLEPARPFKGWSVQA